MIQQQIEVQLRAADTDNNGFIDEKEAEKNRAFKSIFKAVDLNGDGKVSEKEITGYLDGLRDLQARATAACASLIWSDHSRGLFDLLDADGDSRLSRRELRGAARLPAELGRTGPLAKADIAKSYQATVRRGPADGGLGPAAQILALYRGGYTPQDAAGVGPD